MGRHITDFGVMSEMDIFSLEKIPFLVAGILLTLSLQSFFLIIRSHTFSSVAYALFVFLASSIYLIPESDRDISLLLTITAGITFQHSRLTFDLNQIFVQKLFNWGRWLPVALASLLSLLPHLLTHALASVLAFSLSSLLLLCTLHLLRTTSNDTLSCFAAGWGSLAIGQLIEAFLGYDVYSLAPVINYILHLLTYISIILTTIAFSMVLQRTTENRLKYLQRDYALLENEILYERNQRRIYSETLQRMKTEAITDDRAISLRLLQGLSSLLEIESCAVAFYQNGSLEIVSQQEREEAHFYTLVSSNFDQLENMSRQNNADSLVTTSGNEQQDIAYVIPINYESGSWIVAIVCPSGNERLSVNYLQLCQDTAHHACVLFHSNQNYRRLQHQANTDELTDISNRRAFLESARDICQQLQRAREPLSMLYLDIDHFKNINDTYGHDVGDSVLRQFAHICRNSVRVQDLYARYGGEEFLILLPHADTEIAMVIAERIRSRTENHQFASVLNRKITVSIGVSSSYVDGYDIQQMTISTDRALYRAKKKGRNRIEMARWDGKFSNAGHG